MNMLQISAADPAAAGLNGDDHILPEIKNHLRTACGAQYQVLFEKMYTSVAYFVILLHLGRKSRLGMPPEKRR